MIFIFKNKHTRTHTHMRNTSSIIENLTEKEVAEIDLEENPFNLEA